MFFEKISRETGGYRLRDFALFFAVGTIPFSNNLNAWALVSFCVVTFFQSPLLVMPKKLLQSRLWMFSAAYFLWLAASFFWDTTGGFVFKDLERYGAFVIFPVVMTIISPISYRVLLKACAVFVVVVAAVCVVCLIKSAMEYRLAGDYRVFFYHYLGMQMGLNAVILSNYCLESIIWLVVFRFARREASLGLPGWLAGLLCAFFAIMIFLLSSKLIISLLMISGCALILYLGWLKRKLLLAGIAVLVFFLVASLLVNQLPYLRWRLSVTEIKQYQNHQDDQNGLAARLLMWRSAAETIRRKPLTGYGILGAKQELFKQYAANDFEYGVSHRYNAHNQFLETMLIGGIIGLLLYLLLFGKIAYEAVKRKKWLLLILLGHYFCMSMVESLLDVQQELVFFLFFIFLFYFHLPPADEADGEALAQGRARARWA